jgi:hypothetical protein
MAATAVVAARTQAMMRLTALQRKATGPGLAPFNWLNRRLLTSLGESKDQLLGDRRRHNQATRHSRNKRKIPNDAAPQECTTVSDDDLQNPPVDKATQCMEIKFKSDYMDSENLW